MRGLALIVVAFALAEDGGAAPAPATLPAAATQPAAEGEGDEGEHTPPAPTTPAPAPPKPPPTMRQPAVVKDGMVRVPGGRFTMGSSDRNAHPNEKPARAVSTPPFWIDRTEVTASAYRACVESGKCERPARSSSACTYELTDPSLPINCVSWAMAERYCAAVQKRLPREVEWELAARGTSPVRYPWGGSGTSCATAVTLVHDGSQRSCGRKGPTRVGTHLAGASPYGALDMSGNVEEWVSDWYAEGNADLSPRAGASHVLRGGGWLTIPSQSKATSRNWGSVREAGPNVGFRCARDD